MDVSDGVVHARSPLPGDAAVLIAGRDDESRRWLGPGSDDPKPTACIAVDGTVVGWVDFDTEQEWLREGEVNIGHGIFPSSRGRGFASRAVQLLMHHLATTTDHHTGTLMIDRNNARSLAIAARMGFTPAGAREGSLYFTRPVPPTSYSDGQVTIRPQRPDDVDDHLASIDDVQIDWLWLPGQRESWEAMTAQQKRTHVAGVLRTNHDAFGHGPKWTFAVDADNASYVAYVDCDLANPHVPAGEANISYSSHPDHRGRGFASRAVRLALAFVRDHTGAREAHIVVDPANLASMRVAASVGARPAGALVNDEGTTMVRHVVAVR